MKGIDLGLRYHAQVAGAVRAAPANRSGLSGRLEQLRAMMISLSRWLTEISEPITPRLQLVA
jgi:hypothetical protein